jgi:rare lipoprotein A
LKAAERVLVFGSGISTAQEDPLPPNRAPLNERASSRPRARWSGDQQHPSIAADNEEYEMRTIILSAIAAVAAGTLLAGPASAENAPWQCMSPAFACGGAPTAKSHRDRDGYAGERTSRRQVTSKRTRNRVAKTDEVEVKKQKVARTEAAEKPQTKVELPERKQAEKPATTEKSAIAVRKVETQVETEGSVRVTSTQSGIASYYGYGAGSQTASGQRFNPNAMTAAHRTLPFGTKVRVTNKRNGKTVVVTINDRGPFVRGRVIDLSTAAAGVIGMKSSGLAPVTVERIAKN